MGKGGLHIVLRFDQEQFGILDVDPGKADIEVGAQLVGGQRADLIQKHLPLGDGLRRDAGDGLGLLAREEGAIHGEQDLLASGQGVIRFGLRAQSGATGQVGRPAKIGDELREDQPLGVAVVDGGIVEAADGRQARVLLGRADGHNVGGQGGEEPRLELPRDLARRQRPQIGHLDLRVIAERGLVRLRQSERRGVRRAGNGEGEEEKDHSAGKLQPKRERSEIS